MGLGHTESPACGLYPARSRAASAAHQAELFTRSVPDWSWVRVPANTRRLLGRVRAALGLGPAGTAPMSAPSVPPDNHTADEPLVGCLVCHACSYPIVCSQDDLIAERWPDTLKEAVFGYELDLLDMQDVWCYSATNPSGVRSQPPVPHPNPIGALPFFQARG